MGSKECCEGVRISLTSIKNKIADLPDKLTEEDQELSPSAMSQDEPDLSILTESSIKKSSPFEMHFKKTKDLALSEITEEGIEKWLLVAGDLEGLWNVYVFVPGLEWIDA